MKKFVGLKAALAGLFAVSLTGAAVVVAQGGNPAPETAARLCDLEEAVGIGPYDECVPDTTTSTSTTSTTSTTTTTVAPSGGWNDDFATNTLDQYEWFVTHRNVDINGFPNFSGGSWTGDHDENCGPPGTQRDLSWDPSDPYVFRGDSIYWCPVGTGHVMTSVGDVDGYSWAGFTPAVSFTDVVEVAWDVNGTDLGNRQFPEVKIIPADTWDPALPPCVVDLPCNTPSYEFYGGFGIAEFNDEVHIDFADGTEYNFTPPVDVEANASKAIRREHVVTDNGDGTITLFIEGRGTWTVNGSFPDGEVKVILADHNYSPNKACGNAECVGYTWHWDNFRVEVN